jgi:hypothetical protein
LPWYLWWYLQNEAQRSREPQHFISPSKAQKVKPAIQAETCLQKIICNRNSISLNDLMAYKAWPTNHKIHRQTRWLYVNKKETKQFGVAKMQFFNAMILDVSGCSKTAGSV